jgi:hypothetical protein
VIWRVRIAQAGSHPELDEEFPTLPAALSKAAVVMESEARRLWEAEAELDSERATEKSIQFTELARSETRDLSPGAFALHHDIDGTRVLEIALGAER